MGIFLVLVVLGLLVLAVPIGSSLGLASFLAVLAQGRFPLKTVFHTMTSGLTSYILLSIPFFIIAGELMNSEGITEALIRGILQSAKGMDCARDSFCIRKYPHSYTIGGLYIGIAAFQQSGGYFSFAIKAITKWIP